MSARISNGSTESERASSQIPKAYNSAVPAQNEG